MHIDARMYIAQVSRRLLTLSRWVVDLGGERERQRECPVQRMITLGDGGAVHSQCCHHTTTTPSV